MSARMKVLVALGAIAAVFAAGLLIGKLLGMKVDMGWTSYPLGCSEGARLGTVKGAVGSFDEVSWWQQQIYGLQCPGDSGLVVQEIYDTQAYERTMDDPGTEEIEKIVYLIAFVTLGLPATAQ